AEGPERSDICHAGALANTKRAANLALGTPASGVRPEHVAGPANSVPSPDLERPRPDVPAELHSRETDPFDRSVGALRRLHQRGGSPRHAEDAPSSGDDAAGIAARSCVIDGDARDLGGGVEPGDDVPTTWGARVSLGGQHDAESTPGRIGQRARIEVS